MIESGQRLDASLRHVHDLGKQLEEMRSEADRRYKQTVQAAVHENKTVLLGRAGEELVADVIAERLPNHEIIDKSKIGGCADLWIQVGGKPPHPHTCHPHTPHFLPTHF